MKTSNKILLAVAIVPIILVVGTIVSLRIAFEHRDYTKRKIVSSETRILKEYQYSGFKRILVNGIWGLKLSKGNVNYVGISAPESAMEFINVQKNGDQLILDYHPGYQNLDVGYIPKSSIVVPSLSAISLWGTCHLNLSDFSSDYLSIIADGEIQMTASNTAITNLELVSQGVSEWDFSKALVVNARVKANGSFSILLFLDGGQLSGVLDGIGTLAYAGTADISKLKKKNPLSQIIYREML